MNVSGIETAPPEVPVGIGTAKDLSMMDGLVAVGSGLDRCQVA
jgi:hypothetical protein